MNKVALRAAAFYINLMFISFLTVPFSIYSKIVDGSDHVGIPTGLVEATIVSILLLLLLDIKILSPGKRLIGLTVVNVNGDTCVPLWKQIARSLTLLIWPIEALVVVLSSSHRRISDRILGLEVIEIKRKSKE